MVGKTLKCNEESTDELYSAAVWNTWENSTSKLLVDPKLIARVEDSKW